MNAGNAEPAAYGSLQVFDCLREMAAQRTNAGLLMLADAERVETGRRYPDDGLRFAGNRWRTFYHCHPADTRLPGEHGHFHIFTRLGAERWAHVVGLAIDADGQALQWFATNRWVTDGPWLERAQFDALLPARIDENDALATRWLHALLLLYRDQLAQLLAQRDRQLEAHALQRDREAVLEDRELYTLACIDIDLQAMLEHNLLH